MSGLKNVVQKEKKQIHTIILKKNKNMKVRDADILTWFSPQLTEHVIRSHLLLCSAVHQHNQALNPSMQYVSMKTKYKKK